MIRHVLSESTLQDERRERKVFTVSWTPGILFFLFFVVVAWSERTSISVSEMMIISALIVLSIIMFRWWSSIIVDEKEISGPGRSPFWKEKIPLAMIDKERSKRPGLFNRIFGRWPINGRNGAIVIIYSSNLGRAKTREIVRLAGIEDGARQIPKTSSGVIGRRA